MANNNCFLNGEIHHWYKINFGYSDQLVGTLLEHFQVASDARVLDPFCGSGTTIIECMKRGIAATGIDANPSSVFAAKVKTNWKLNPVLLERHLANIIEEKKIISKPEADRTYQYLISSGMIQRGWISLSPLIKAISIKKAIANLSTTQNYKNALMLALISELINNSSNIKFGPELYCGPIKKDSNVHLGFQKRVETMCKDLRKARNIPSNESKIFRDDARNISCFKEGEKFDFLITSPPYPTEHDYTRNARLELAFLEEVLDRDSLRQIKKGMIRSHTKGIYSSDDDSKFVSRFNTIRTLEKDIDQVAKDKTHGFARLYSKVMKEYFGGMRRHLRSVYPFMKKGAICAYTVGDQASYLQVPIPTAKILSEIAKTEGYSEIETIHFRNRWSSTTSKYIEENILVLRRQ